MLSIRPYMSRVKFHKPDKEKPEICKKNNSQNLYRVGRHWISDQSGESSRLPGALSGDPKVLTPE